MKGQGEAIDPQLNVDGERITVNGYVTDVLTDYVGATSCSASHGKAVHGVPGAQGAAPERHAARRRVRGRSCRASGPGSCRPSAIAAATRSRRCRGGANAQVAPERKPALQRAIDRPAAARRPATGHAGRGRARSAGDAAGRGREPRADRRQALRDMGELDNTVIVFTSDHGYFYGEHGLNEERRLAYEETARIPLIVRYPARRQGGRQRVRSWCRSSTWRRRSLELAGRRRHGAAPGPFARAAARRRRHAVAIVGAARVLQRPRLPADR